MQQVLFKDYKWSGLIFSSKIEPGWGSDSLLGKKGEAPLTRTPAPFSDTLGWEGGKVWVSHPNTELSFPAQLVRADVIQDRSDMTTGYIQFFPFCLY